MCDKAAVYLYSNEVACVNILLEKRVLKYICSSSVFILALASVCYYSYEATVCLYFHGARCV